MIGKVLLVLSAIVLLTQPVQAAGTPPECAKCEEILREIRAALRQRCDLAPSREELRERQIYLFLSIFAEISSGIDPQSRKRIVNAALNGMSCNDPDAGVRAAQEEARRLMQSN